MLQGVRIFNILRSYGTITLKVGPGGLRVKAHVYNSFLTLMTNIALLRTALQLIFI